MKKKIHILPIGYIEREILKDVSRKLTEAFGLECKELDALDKPSYAYDPARGQYHSIQIIKRMIRVARRDAIKILGITDVDLCTPVLTFVFGEAQLEGRCAVISLWRLRPEFYDEEENSNIFYSRVEKEAIHEIGHTIGLPHCHDVNCVMHASSTIYDTDLKADTFCPSCQWHLAQKSVENFKKEC